MAASAGRLAKNRLIALRVPPTSSDFVIDFALPAEGPTFSTENDLIPLDTEKPQATAHRLFTESWESSFGSTFSALSFPQANKHVQRNLKYRVHFT
jgi:hypothetical protein